jgi:pyruvate carboxylase
MDITAEQAALTSHLGRDPSAEELVMYLNHPGDALKTIEFKRNFGDPNNLPLDVWFEGLEQGQELYFYDSNGKPHYIVILDISAPDHRGLSVVRYMLDSEFFTYQVKVAEATSAGGGALEMADRENPLHIASPSGGDLWVMHVKPGQLVRKGEELFNITIMKQEKAVLSPMDGLVRRVLKFADYLEDKKMVPVKEGELLVELAPISATCPGCSTPVSGQDARYCAECGQKLLQ